jgi:signal transduction histidine kinase
MAMNGSSISLASRKDPIAYREPNADHVVRFYESDDILCDAVADFLMEGLTIGQPIVVIATEPHRDALTERMKSNGFDIERSCRAGQLNFLDARQTLSLFMTAGMPDARRFRTCIGGVIEQSLRERSATNVRAYGEMVDVLWRDGNPAAALRLEELWNELAAAYSFQLLCAYAMGNFYSAAHSHQLEQVCNKHGRVIPAESFLYAVEDDARAREICMLQQRARALEAEIEHRKQLELALSEALADRRLAEEQARAQAEEAERANRAKSEFLAVMSHELRTPLNAIVGYRDLLDNEIGGPVTPIQKLYLDRIESGARQLLRLINQVLSLSRIEAGKEEITLERVDIGATVRETCALVEPAAVKKGITLAVLLPDRSVTCHTDDGKLRQILLDLVSNAVKFTEWGGVQLHVRTTESFIQFDVRDTGVGVLPENQERIFEPFVQIDHSPSRRTAGTGLGLPVSRELARLLGGDITLRSANGHGSTFSLRIPRRA